MSLFVRRNVCKQDIQLKLRCLQGTIAKEILHEIPDLDAILVPVGGGGMLSGMALYAHHFNPACKGSRDISE